MESTDMESGKKDLTQNNKLIDAALKFYSKGEKLVFKRKFKSAEKFFKKAFNNFIQINDRTRGEKVLLKLAECYIIEKQYLNAASTMRDAANLRLLSHKFINAIEHYQSVIELLLKAEESRTIRQKILEIVSFISLCYMAVGDFERSIDFLRKNIKKYARDLKSKSTILILNNVTQLNNLIYKKDINLFNELKDEIPKLGLREGETELFNWVFNIIGVFLNSKINLKISKKEIRAGDEFDIIGVLESNSDIEIKKIDLILDHGLKILSKPEIFDNNKKFKAKITSIISGKFKIKMDMICKTKFYEFPMSSTKILKIEQGSPIIQFYPSIEDFSWKLEKSVPLEFVVKNIGRGEAINLKLELELPPQIKLIEGTNVKQLHSLGPNEEFVFVFNLKGIVIGSHKIISKLNYEGNNSDDEFPQIIKEIDIEVFS